MGNTKIKVRLLTDRDRVRRRVRKCSNLIEEMRRERQELMGIRESTAIANAEGFDTPKKPWWEQKNSEPVFVADSDEERLTKLSRQSAARSAMYAQGGTEHIMALQGKAQNAWPYCSKSVMDECESIKPVSSDKPESIIQRVKRSCKSVMFAARRQGKTAGVTVMQDCL